MVQNFIHFGNIPYIDNSLLFQKNIFQNFVTPRGMRMLFLRLKAAAAGNEGETVVYGTAREKNSEIFSPCNTLLSLLL